MVEDPITPEVRHFIVVNIDSIAQLEALLILRADPAGIWDESAVAKRLYISEQETSTLLAGLCERGLVAAGASDSLQYTYRPASGDMARLVDHLAEVYSKHLVQVTNLIHSNRETRRAM